MVVAFAIALAPRAACRAATGYGLLRHDPGTDSIAAEQFTRVRNVLTGVCVGHLEAPAKGQSPGERRTAIATVTGAAASDESSSPVLAPLPHAKHPC
jgi:hypothetical protein